MIIVSKPSAEATRLADTGRYRPTRSRSSAAHNDTPKHTNVQWISVHTAVVACPCPTLGD